MKSNVEVLREYVDSDTIDEVFSLWREPHRKFHNLDHLFSVLDKLYDFKNEIVDERQWDALVLAAFFHDSVYWPGDETNEDKSAEKLISSVKDQNVGVVLVAKEIILSTKKIENKNGVFDIFQRADCNCLFTWSFDKLLLYESQIFEEFKKFSWDEYKTKRLSFLTSFMEKFPNNNVELKKLCDYIRHRRPKIGIYAGSFNPFHVGHLNVLQQAEKIFDKVVVAFGTNPDKEETVAVVPTAIQDRECVVYTGLLPDLLKKYESMGCEVTLVRGLRNEYDLNYEQNLIQYVKDMMPSLKVVLLLCDREFNHVSSSNIRSLIKCGADVESSQYIVV